MSSVSQSITCQYSGESYRIERLDNCDEQQQMVALAMLLTGKNNTDDPAVHQFIHFTRCQQLALDNLWAMYPQQQAGNGAALVASLLLIRSAGRTAMLFVSPPHGLAKVDLIASFIQAVCTAQNPDQIRLIQTLLDMDQYLIKKVLVQAGFQHLATLQYMRGRSIDQSVPLTLENEQWRILHYYHENHDAFARVILASYEQTMDCPGLVGKRQIDDIIAGHMSTGRFDPALWFAIYHEQSPAGVMLINEVSHQKAHELVYLGLARPYRGRGLAEQLLRHGLSIIAERGSTEMLLAVDHDNKPAVRLYQSLSFQATVRKHAMIFILE